MTRPDTFTCVGAFSYKVIIIILNIDNQNTHFPLYPKKI
nr:MAG TPA: hypothetical protein [Caudoviricetes sp.]